MKIAVLMGGRSAEREISLRTGRGIAQALRNLGHEVTALDAATGRLLPAGGEEQARLGPGEPGGSELMVTGALTDTGVVAEAEVVFVALHGGAGEDGTVQALLDLTGKPYTGSGMLASALAMDKAMSKRVFEHEHIPTPSWIVVDRGAGPAEVDSGALGGYPLVVKPNEQGSTVGLTVVTRAEDLPAALDLAFEYGDQVLIEQFIPGRELTVAVIGDEALPVVEIRPRSGHYDYEAKYTSGMSEYFCPADLPAAVAERVRDLGVRAARALGCRGVSRVDFRLDPGNAPYCLEVNTIPGMTPTSLVPMAAKASGMTYDQLVGRMVELALDDWRTRQRRARRDEATRT